jgi:hypothetical protein
VASSTLNMLLHADGAGAGVVGWKLMQARSSALEAEEQYWTMAAMHSGEWLSVRHLSFWHGLVSSVAEKGHGDGFGVVGLLVVVVLVEEGSVGRDTPQQPTLCLRLSSSKLPHHVDTMAMQVTDISFPPRQAFVEHGEPGAAANNVSQMDDGSGVGVVGWMLQQPTSSALASQYWTTAATHSGE